MGIGPLIAWRRASLRSLGRTFLWPFGVALAAGVVLLALGAGSSIPGLIAYTFGAFVLASIVLEFVRGTRARRALGAASWPAAFSSLVARNRRRYGGYVVHAAIVLLAIGVAGSSLYQTVARAAAAAGADDARRRLHAHATASSSGATRRTRRSCARCSTSAAATATSARCRAGKNSYPVEQQVSNEVAIRSDLLTGEDLFVIADQIDRATGTVYFKVFVKPLVNLIWLAGLVFLLGALSRSGPTRASSAGSPRGPALAPAEA